MEVTKTEILYKGKIQIDFYGPTEDSPKRHIYKLRGNKERLLSVTSATGIIDKSGPLMNWAIRVTKEYLIECLEKRIKISIEDIEAASKQHRIKKEKAASIGSIVHQFAEDYINKKKPEIPEKIKGMKKDDMEKVRNGIIAFLKWVTDHKIKFVASEKLVYSKKHNFVGLMDVVYKEKGKLVAGDFKTSKSGHYHEHKFQLSAYRGADEEESGVKYNRSAILHFDKETGDFEVIECVDHAKDYKTFLSCLAIKKRLKELK